MASELNSCRNLVSMINPSELRIGNFVECTFGIRRIKGIVNDKEKSATVSFEDSLPDDSQLCSGIPITPELLDRCGFIIHKNGLYVNNAIWLELNQGRFVTPMYSDGTSFRSAIGKHITYHHQLQNLYFALTGEELIIKELA
jgi:hypothetical protein